MPFEQFRVLMAAMTKFNKELVESASEGLSKGMNPHQKERTTFRVTNEE